MKYVIVRNIILPYKTSKDEALNQAQKSLLRFFSIDDFYNLNICKRSVDARNKNDICFNYSVKAILNEIKSFDSKLLLKHNIFVEDEAKLDISFGHEKLDSRPIVVGFGPSGMFCAYILTLYGYKPIVIERGEEVFKRQKIVSEFYQNHILNENTNIQYGAGGAGTFSDGKLMTRINNPLSNMVIETLHKFGAPDSILYEAKPHIGSDKLISIVDNISNYIKDNGGDIYYNTQLIDIREKNKRIYSLVTTKGEMHCGAVILAIGHSARDTITNLRKNNLYISPKPFSIGFRIEHLQQEMDEINYGKNADLSILPHVEYSLSTKANNRGVYTFCMCPGGLVVPAMSNKNTVITNGMSNYKRDGYNSNSAVCCSINLEDVSNNPDIAQDYLENIEKNAYILGGGDYKAPCQTVGSFLRNENNSIKRINPTYMNGNVTMTKIDSLFKNEILTSLKIGLKDFSKKIKNFDNSDAVITAPETRTSSPIRIDRKDDCTSINFDNLYPCGEGAGYSGGITSSAIDGIRCAEKIINRYLPIES